MNFTKAGVITCFLLFPLSAKDAGQGDASADGKFIQYLAGIEMLEHSKNLTSAVITGKYRELCSITGISSDSAVKRIEQFKGQPELWQKIQARVLELLQSLK